MSDWIERVWWTDVPPGRGDGFSALEAQIEHNLTGQMDSPLARALMDLFEYRAAQIHDSWKSATRPEDREAFWHAARAIEDVKDFLVDKFCWQARAKDRQRLAEQRKLVDEQQLERRQSGRGRFSFLGGERLDPVPESVRNELKGFEHD